jgi:HK97 family phage portal protein
MLAQQPALFGGRVMARDGSLLPPPGTWGLPGAYVYDSTSARRIPAVGRALSLLTGLIKQMPMDAYRGYQRLPQPRLLSRPDPDRGGPWFVQVSAEDYLLNGNAIAVITSRGADGWPLTVMWLPTTWVQVVWNPYNLDPDAVLTYYYAGVTLPTENVIHVRRSADRGYPVRGVGIVEEHLSTLDRMAQEEEYERGALAGGAVPSVAIITPQTTLTQGVADEAKDNWMSKFSGPVREPAILPNGTQVIPLAWSPTDAQLNEARQLSMIDVANIFNLNSYWTNAPGASMTYRTAAPLYQEILRTSIEPILADLEDAWSDAWLPRGTTVRFRRGQLLREDLATTTTAAVASYGAGITTLAEARVELGLPPTAAGELGSGADMNNTGTADPPVAAEPDDPNNPDTGGTDAPST